MGMISAMVWTRALGFMYAVLLAFGAAATLVCGVAFYRATHDTVTVVSTVVSGYATYAVGLVAIYVAAHQLDRFFRWLYDATKSWRLPLSTDWRVVIFGIPGLLLGWRLWQ